MIRVHRNGGWGQLYISIVTDNGELYEKIDDLITEYELKAVGEQHE